MRPASYYQKRSHLACILFDIKVSGNGCPVEHFTPQPESINVFITMLLSYQSFLLLCPLFASGSIITRESQVESRDEDIDNFENNIPNHVIRMPQDAKQIVRSDNSSCCHYSQVYSDFNRQRPTSGSTH